VGRLAHETYAARASNPSGSTLGPVMSSNAPFASDASVLHEQLARDCSLLLMKEQESIEPSATATQGCVISQVIDMISLA
jgi:hypothetical protein